MVLCCVEEQAEKSEFLQTMFPRPDDRWRFKENINNFSVWCIVSVWKTEIICSIIEEQVVFWMSIMKDHDSDHES